MLILLAVLAGGVAAVHPRVWAWVPFVGPASIIAAFLISSSRQRGFEEAAGIGVDNSALYTAMAVVVGGGALAVVVVGLVVRRSGHRASAAWSVGALAVLLAVAGGLGLQAARVDDGGSVERRADCDPDQRTLDGRGPQALRGCTSPGGGFYAVRAGSRGPDLALVLARR